MKKLSSVRDTSTREGNGGYVPVRHKDGNITCSCGRELVKLDESTYRCAAGWPMYRLDEGDIMKDKNGDLLMRQMEH